MNGMCFRLLTLMFMKDVDDPHALFKWGWKKVLLRLWYKNAICGNILQKEEIMKNIIKN